MVSLDFLATVLANIKHYLLVAVKNAIGDQKIDLIITDKKQIKANTFLQVVLPQSVMMDCY